MKHQFIFLSIALAIFGVAGFTSYASAQETSTEVWGYYEGYRNFDYKTGGTGYPAIKGAEMNGGGGGIAYNLAPWFSLWTQVSFLGTAENDEMRVRIINNLQGVRYMTPKYGPFSFYGKGGLGFSNYSVELIDFGSIGDTKFSAAYGGGVQVWLTDYLGLTLEASHLIMGVPHLFDSDGRDRWDSGLDFKTGVAVRF